MADIIEYCEPTWRGLNMRQLKVDEAFLRISSSQDKQIYIYQRTDECFECPYTKLETLRPNSHQTIPIYIAYDLHFTVLDTDEGSYVYGNETSLCKLNPSGLREFGVYNLTIKDDQQCQWATDHSGVNVNLSLLATVVLILLLLMLFKCGLWLKNRLKANTSSTNTIATGSTSSESVGLTTRSLRILSLDVFRGMSIALMIFVNSGGGHYWWIEHATWNGLHLADVVFPAFLWIMGVCLPISLRSQRQRLTSRMHLIRRIINRSLKLFFFGICLNSINGPRLEELRIMGVLQRFAIAYFVCGVLYLTLMPVDYTTIQDDWKRIIHDLLVMRKLFIVMFVIIIVHLSIVFGWKAPNCPRGYLGPGGKHEYGVHFNCTGGIIGYIDRNILGEAHMYKHSSARRVYDGQIFDPEGVFGCLLTIVHVLLGVHCGIIIQIYTEWSARIKRWVLWAFFSLLVTLSLTHDFQESGLIPLNKNLWSLSFVFVNVTLSLTIFSILYYIIDVRKWWGAHVFSAAGKNAILMYLGHSLMHKLLPWHWRIGAMNTHFILLLESIWNTTLWLIIAYELDRKRFYYKV